MYVLYNLCTRLPNDMKNDRGAKEKKKPRATVPIYRSLRSFLFVVFAAYTHAPLCIRYARLCAGRGA